MMMPRSTGNEVLVPFRQSGGKAAIVFLHGFCGESDKTWGDFPLYLMSNPGLKGWDIYGLGYPTSLRIDIPGIWRADPGLEMVSRQFRTVMRQYPLKDYEALAFVAHSMGGLVVQHALLDPVLAERVNHMFLFGTPSAGLSKALFGRIFKRQARDMSVGSPFLKKLRTEWDRLYANGLPFKLRVVAGNRDEFVPSKSSLDPFPEDVKDVVHGDHLSIVKPTSATSQSVRLVVEGLSGLPNTQGIIDSAMLAVEQGNFRKAIGLLGGQVGSLDDNALVQYALALEGCGRGMEALEVLEARFRSQGTAPTEAMTDAMGTLAGRLKRRWLVQRAAEDLERAKQLYSEALGRAEAAGDADQAMYHAINVAFLEAMSAPAASSVPPSAQDAARKAMEHAVNAKVSHWREATMGEGLIILGDIQAAYLAYARAMAHRPFPRQIDSMHSQAIILAQHALGSQAAKKIDMAFRVDGTG